MRIKYTSILISISFIILSCNKLQESGYGHMTLILADIASRAATTADLQDVVKFKLSLTDSSDKTLSKTYIFDQAVAKQKKIDITDPLYGNIILALSAYNKYDLESFAGTSTASISKTKINNVKLSLDPVYKLISINLSFTKSNAGFFMLDPSRTPNVEAIDILIASKKTGSTLTSITVDTESRAVSLDDNVPKIIVNSSSNIDILFASSLGLYDSDLDITISPKTSPPKTEFERLIIIPPSEIELPANTYVAKVNF